MIVLDFTKRLGSFTVEGRLQLKKGFNVLLGPSGCGKTTTLRVMCGLEKPERGYMECCGEVFMDTERGVFLPPQRRRLGVVFQEPSLFPHMTVKENLLFALKKAQGSPPSLEELLETFRLKGLEERYPRQLSGGQRQRVALARLLAYDPKALLMDEPFSSLDFKTKLELMELLKEVNLSKPVLFITHDPFEALYLGERFFLMKEGKVVAEGGREVVEGYVDLSKIRSLL